MPSTSAKQHRFMEAAAHNPGFAQKAGIPVSTAAEFVSADQAAKKFAEGGSVEGHGLSIRPVNENPSEAQKDAGNYLKAPVYVHGMRITVENPAGTVRKGVGADGNEWHSDVRHDYGYIRGTTGRDKDHLDVFLGPHAQRSDVPVHVVDQVDPETGEFDEHKVILGAKDADHASEVYHANYEPGWRGFGDVTPMSMKQFKDWAFDGRRKMKPVSELRRGYAEGGSVSQNIFQARRAALDEAETATVKGEDTNKAYQDSLREELRPAAKPPKESVRERVRRLTGYVDGGSVGKAVRVMAPVVEEGVDMLKRRLFGLRSAEAPVVVPSGALTRVAEQVPESAVDIQKALGSPTRRQILQQAAGTVMRNALPLGELAGMAREVSPVAQALQKAVPSVPSMLKVSDTENMLMNIAFGGGPTGMKAWREAMEQGGVYPVAGNTKRAWSSAYSKWRNGWSGGVMEGGDKWIHRGEYLPGSPDDVLVNIGVLRRSGDDLELNTAHPEARGIADLHNERLQEHGYPEDMELRWGDEPKPGYADGGSVSGALQDPEFYKDMARNAAALGNRTVAYIAGGPTDLADLALKGVNWATGSRLPVAEEPVGSSAWIMKEMRKRGIPTSTGNTTADEYGDVGVGALTMAPVQAARMLGKAAKPLAAHGAMLLERGMSDGPLSAVGPMFAVKPKGGYAAGGSVAPDQPLQGPRPLGMGAMNLGMDALGFGGSSAPTASTSGPQALANTGTARVVNAPDRGKGALDAAGNILAAKAINAATDSSYGGGIVALAQGKDAGAVARDYAKNYAIQKAAGSYAPYAGAAIQAAQGDAKGAAWTTAGTYAGTAVGSYFGMPTLGAAVGGLAGGVVGSMAPEIQDSDWYRPWDYDQRTQYDMRKAGEHAVGAVGDTVGHWGESLAKAGGCFITTATMQARGDDNDDSFELSTLRNFRDNVMMREPHLAKMAQEYEVLAPAVTQAIQQLPHAGQVFKDLHREFIFPAAVAAHGGDNTKALELYSRMLEHVAPLVIKLGSPQQARQAAVLGQDASSVADAVAQ